LPVLFRATLAAMNIPLLARPNIKSNPPAVRSCGRGVSAIVRGHGRRDAVARANVDQNCQRPVSRPIASIARHKGRVNRVRGARTSGPSRRGRWQGRLASIDSFRDPRLYSGRTARGPRVSKTAPATIPCKACRRRSSVLWSVTRLRGRQSFAGRNSTMRTTRQVRKYGGIQIDDFRPRGGARIGQLIRMDHDPGHTAPAPHRRAESVGAVPISPMSRRLIRQAYPLVNVGTRRTAGARTTFGLGERVSVELTQHDAWRRCSFPWGRNGSG